MVAEPTVDNDPGKDTGDLRDTLFRTLGDLRAGRISAQEAKVVTTAVTKVLLGSRIAPMEAPSGLDALGRERALRCAVTSDTRRARGFGDGLVAKVMTRAVGVTIIFAGLFMAAYGALPLVFLTWAFFTGRPLSDIQGSFCLLAGASVPVVIFGWYCVRDLKASR
jgi:hypothetical protein